MQTGIELTRLILGVVPVFQAASGDVGWLFNHCRTASSAAKTQEKLEYFLTNLHYELSLLQMAVEKLINELNTLHVDEKDALKKGSNPRLWTDPRVTRAVEDRLGAGYETFQLHVTKLLEQLERLAPKEETSQLSGLQSSSVHATGVFTKLRHLQAQRQSSKADGDILSRFRFNINEDKRTRILGKIALYNGRIATLLDFSTPSSVYTDENIRRPSSKQLRHFHLRPLAHNLHETLGKLWPCDCGRVHQARLCLLECPQNPEHPTDTIFFNLLTSIHKDASDEFCSWVESKIAVVADPDHPRTSRNKVMFALDQTSTEPSPPSSPLTRTLSGFTIINSPPTSRRDSLISQTTSPPMTKRSSLPRVPVVSFHTEVSASLRPGLCAQMLFEDNVLYKIQSCRNKLLIEASHPGTSLADLLLQKRPFTLRERRILAVILAHSLLHFCESPWLSRHWDKKHLSFFKRTSNTGQYLDVQRPWISADFQDASPFVDVDELERIHPNPSVLALGILLLEIETTAGIEESQTEDDLPPNGEADCNTTLFTAERLLQSKCNDVFERYRKAIEACLKCDFVVDGASTSLNDDEFRQAVYDNIVAPLEEELEIGFMLKPEDLGLEKC